MVDDKPIYRSFSSNFRGGRTRCTPGAGLGLSRFRPPFGQDGVKVMVTIRIAAVGIVVCLLLGTLVPLRGQGPRPAISDGAFSEMVAGFSEEGGTFRYENLVSNETS